VVLMESGYIPYDVSNGVIKFSISDISNDSISGMGRPIDSSV